MDENEKFEISFYSEYKKMLEKERRSEYKGKSEKTFLIGISLDTIK